MFVCTLCVGFLGSQKWAEGIRSHEAGGDCEPFNMSAGHLTASNPDL